MELAAKSSRKKATAHFDGLKIPDLICPKSAYQGHSIDLPTNSEKDVLGDFLVGCLWDFVTMGRLTIRC